MRTTWARFAIGVSLFAAGAVSAVVVQQYLSRRNPHDELAREVRNDRLQWTGDIVGLVPIPSDGFEAAIKSRGDTAIAHLLDMLDDPARFAAAHVALTQIYVDVPPRDTSQWNGLHLLLNADGSVVYDQQDVTRLKQQWNKFPEVNAELR